MNEEKGKIYEINLSTILEEKKASIGREGMSTVPLLPSASIYQFSYHVKKFHVTTTCIVQVNKK